MVAFSLMLFVAGAGFIAQTLLTAGCEKLMQIHQTRWRLWTCKAVSLILIPVVFYLDAPWEQREHLLSPVLVFCIGMVLGGIRAFFIRPEDLGFHSPQ